MMTWWETYQVGQLLIRDDVAGIVKEGANLLLEMNEIMFNIRLLQSAVEQILGNDVGVGVVIIIIFENN
jgi:hypothetical protein